MEVELFSNVISEEDTVEVDVENDNFGADGERCGICMDTVVDRGVLDCCEHWFCFVCIDNWASITNLCPLCQNEFQLITCVPVYDTIGGNKTDEDLEFRDDDWFVEGKNNTLSFPSYYIDENAVTCLDGNGCKIRSGSVTYEESLTLDTSIACDSCDIWYHAFCVGFDPEAADVDSWLCPRCLASGPQQNSDFRETYRTQTQLDSGSTDNGCMVDTCSGKMSISVADDGETAVVVSRIGGEHHVEKLYANELPAEKHTNHHDIETCTFEGDSCLPELRNSVVCEVKDTQPEDDIPSAQLDESIVDGEPNGDDSTMCLNPESSFDATCDDKTKVILDGNESLHVDDASGNKISTDGTLKIVEADLAPKSGQKHKRTDYSFLMEDEPDKTRLEHSTIKKVKSQQVGQKASLNDPADASASNDHKRNNSQMQSSVDEIGRNLPAKKTKSIDIMSIVRGKEPLKRFTQNTHEKKLDKAVKVQKTAARLRVKKIMRRPSEDQDSADAVQKLRNEIREVVDKNPSNDIGKKIVDPNLLAAFRVAVTGSASESVKKTSLKAKKLTSQKGKTREKITKKIYATSNGKRKRAWDRDCMVEFWKHRCKKTAKPEKIETLRSVLNLLKWNPETKHVDQELEEEVKAPMLSRLYLADASVFPRKDDIKPLSVLKAASCSKQNEELSSNKNDSKASPNHFAVIPPNGNEVLTQTNASQNGNNGAASRKPHSDKQPDKSSSQKMTCKSDTKIDKRKWALEVLARKTASGSTGSMHQKEDSSVFKGSYPLLAELPTDMRPKLEPIRHNKIPVSVRQAQLYRLAEHFLKMANLSSIRRTAASELAVADAINIEKQVADRSNSKSVYMNLCSQEIRHHTNSNNSGTPNELIPSIPLTLSNEGIESSASSIDSETEAALRAAGLLPDSPDSPNDNVEDVLDDGNAKIEMDKEGKEDIFGMDPQTDLDIYGDFEYDLDEEYCVGASATEVSMSQAEEGESKMKVVFSTLNSNKADGILDDKQGDITETENLSNATQLPESCDDADGGSSVGNDMVDTQPIPADTSLGKDDELSLADCEELYGPDKEPLANKFPMLPTTENLAPSSTNNLEDKNPKEQKSNSSSCQGNAVGVKSPSPPHAIKIIQVEKKDSDPKVDKKSEHVESVHKKVEAYVKEHIRPLCKSGVITVEQYRWAVGKTTDKVMKYHPKAKNANFLIKEGEKVKKLAEQYVETAKHKGDK